MTWRDSRGERYQIRKVHFLDSPGGCFYELTRLQSGTRVKVSGPYAREEGVYARAKEMGLQLLSGDGWDTSVCRDCQDWKDGVCGLYGEERSGKSWCRYWKGA